MNASPSVADSASAAIMHIAPQAGAPSSERHHSTAAAAVASTSTATMTFSAPLYWFSSVTRSPSGVSAIAVQASSSAEAPASSAIRSRVGRTPATASSAAAARPACQTT